MTKQEKIKLEGSLRQKQMELQGLQVEIKNIESLLDIKHEPVFVNNERN